MITAIEAHAGGEPGRVITGGVPDVPGVTMLAKQRYLCGDVMTEANRAKHPPKMYVDPETKQVFLGT